MLMFIMAKNIKQMLNNRKFSAFQWNSMQLLKMMIVSIDRNRVGKKFTVSCICDLFLFSLGYCNQVL